MGTHGWGRDLLAVRSCRCQHGVAVSRAHLVKRGVYMAAMLIARFRGDVEELSAAYDRGHALIMSRGGAVPFGELRHHCATDEDSLYIIGVWESEAHIRR